MYVGQFMLVVCTWWCFSRDRDEEVAAVNSRRVRTHGRIDKGLPFRFRPKALDYLAAANNAVYLPFPFLLENIVLSTHTISRPRLLMPVFDSRVMIRYRARHGM
jgi:hypothetical protein